MATANTTIIKALNKLWDRGQPHSLKPITSEILGIENIVMGSSSRVAGF